MVGLLQNSSTNVTNGSSVVHDTVSLGGIYLVTSLLVIVTNIIVVIVVAFSRDLHLPTLWNIAFMAACDFCVGLHFLVFAVPSAFMGKFAFPETWVKIASYTLPLLYGQNGFNVVLASVDRYISLCWPMKYEQLMTSRRFLLAIGITVLINSFRVVFIDYPKYDANYEHFVAICSPKFESLVNVLASTVVPSVTILITIVLLLRITIELSVSKRRVLSTGQQVRNSSLTIMIVISVAVFVLCYVPTSIGLVYGLIVGVEKVSGVYKRFAIISFMSNSLWNVGIYAGTFKPFRNGFLRMFCRRYYRRQCQRETEMDAYTERQQNQ